MLPGRRMGRQWLFCRKGSTCLQGLSAVLAAAVESQALVSGSGADGWLAPCPTLCMEGTIFPDMAFQLPGSATIPHLSGNSPYLNRQTKPSQSLTLIRFFRFLNVPHRLRRLDYGTLQQQSVVVYLECRSRLLNDITANTLWPLSSTSREYPNCTCPRRSAACACPYMHSALDSLLCYVSCHPGWLPLASDCLLTNGQNTR